MTTSQFFRELLALFIILLFPMCLLFWLCIMFCGPLDFDEFMKVAPPECSIYGHHSLNIAPITASMDLLVVCTGIILLCTALIGLLPRLNHRPNQVWKISATLSLGCSLLLVTSSPRMLKLIDLHEKLDQYCLGLKRLS